MSFAAFASLDKLAALAMKWLFQLSVIVSMMLCGYTSEGASPQYYAVVRSFGFPEKSAPWFFGGDLIRGSDGRLYGEAMEWTSCVVFSVLTNGSDLKVLARHGNIGQMGQGLVEGTDGRLYGSKNDGIFSLEKDGSGFQRWTNLFDGLVVSKLLEGSDGFLYGTVLPNPSGQEEACLYRVAKDGSDFKIIHRFVGARSTTSHFLRSAGPVGNLLEMPQGELTGVLSATNGGVYRIRLDGSNYRVICAMGGLAGTTNLLTNPWPGVVGHGGKLFGTAQNTQDSKPIVYSINEDGSGLRVLHGLSKNALYEPVIGEGGRVRGILFGGWGDMKIFEMDLDGANFRETTLTDPGTQAPIHPMGTPLAMDGRLLGTADDIRSGSPGGFLYEFNPGATNALKILRRFLPSGGDGRGPNTIVYSAEEKAFYGTCMEGGEFEWGTLWRLSEDGKDYRVLRNFSYPVDAGFPLAVMEGESGWLYGILKRYGTSQPDNPSYVPLYGSVFRVSRTGEGFEVVRSHSFEWPSSILRKDGRIYVTVAAPADEPYKSAYIYSMKGDGSDYREECRFAANETRSLGQLVEGSDGNFYLTGNAKIFRVTPSGQKTVLHSWMFSRGPYPLMEGSDGRLYGNGWEHGFFSINKDGTGYTNQAFGQYETGGLRMIEESPGEFLLVDDGAMYRGDVGRKSVEIFRSFNYHSDRILVWGRAPVYGLIKGGSNVVYGLTRVGGPLGLGTVFRFGGAAPESPRLETMRTNNVTYIKSQGALGTQFRLEVATAPEGPWSEAAGSGGYIDVGFMPQRWSLATNEFYRVRLIED